MPLKAKSVIQKSSAKYWCIYTEKLDNASVSQLFGISQATVYRIDREALETLC